MSRIARAWQQSNVFSHKSYCLYVSTKATTPLTDTTWPRIRWRGSCTCRTPTPDASTARGRSRVRQSPSRTWRWWQEREITVCLLTKRSAAMEDRPRRLFSRDPKVSQKCIVGLLVLNLNSVEWFPQRCFQLGNRTELKCLRHRMHFDWHERSSQSTVSF